MKLLKKNFLPFLFTLFLLVGLISGVYLIGRIQEVRKEAVSPKVNASLTTDSLTIGQNATFNVSVLLIPPAPPDELSISAASIFVNYPADKLTLEQVTPGNFFMADFVPSQTEMLNIIDTSTAGVAKIHLGAPCAVCTTGAACQPGQACCKCFPQNKTDILANLQFRTKPDSSGTATISLDLQSAVSAIGQAENILNLDPLPQVSVGITEPPETTPTPTPTTELTPTPTTIPLFCTSATFNPDTVAPGRTSTASLNFTGGAPNFECKFGASSWSVPGTSTPDVPTTVSGITSSPCAQEFNQTPLVQDTEGVEYTLNGNLVTDSLMSSAACPSAYLKQQGINLTFSSSPQTIIPGGTASFVGNPSPGTNGWNGNNFDLTIENCPLADGLNCSLTDTTLTVTTTTSTPPGTYIVGVKANEQNSNYWRIGQAVLVVTSRPSLTFSLKFQGISKLATDKKVRVILIQQGQEKYRFNEVNVTSDQNGVYSGTITDFEPGTYDVFIKGESHLQRKFTNVTFNEGINIQDFSGTILKAGDFDNDNDIDILDIGGKMLPIYTALEVPVTADNRIYDVDGDNNIDIMDISLVLVNYTALLIEGEK